VQQELKLTEQQRRAIDDLPRRVRESLQADFDQLKGLQEAERREKSRELRTKFQAEFPKALAAILTPAQQNRLKQLNLQHSGLTAFTEPDVVRSLQLSDDQKKEIDNHVHECQKAILEAYRHLGETDEARKKASLVRKEALAKIENVMADQQRKLWKEMIGAPFHFPDQAVAPSSITVAPSPRPVEKAGLAKGSLEWVVERVRAWQPTDEERRIDRIGWAPNLRKALDLAAAHQRPLFVFNCTGRIELNRC
jgi:hypothetical protein